MYVCDCLCTSRWPKETAAVQTLPLSCQRLVRVKVQLGEGSNSADGKKKGKQILALWQSVMPRTGILRILTFQPKYCPQSGLPTCLNVSVLHFSNLHLTQSVHPIRSKAPERPTVPPVLAHMHSAAIQMPAPRKLHVCKTDANLAL